MENLRDEKNIQHIDFRALFLGGVGLPLNFSIKIKCLSISEHCFPHKELISNIQSFLQEA